MFTLKTSSITRIGKVNFNSVTKIRYIGSISKTNSSHQTSRFSESQLCGQLPVQS